MFKKLFGKKDKNYFLEIEEKTKTSESSAEKTTSTTVVETAQTKEVEASKPQVESPKSKGKKTVTVSKTKSTPTYEPPEWVKAIKNYSDVQSSEEIKKSPFADQYLMKNTPRSRRKPGPSLNSFKQMASTMKIK